jgi:uncharacterized protein YutE (UPF0331/DUF86 family)
MDVIAMLLKDLGRDVGDDYQNIEKLVDIGQIPSTLGNNLKKCNGLRNILVHKYNGVDEKIALESYEEVKDTLHDLIETVEDILDELATN